MDRKTEPNWRERALFLFSPKRAQEAYAQRLKREREPESGTDRRARMAASGYGAHAASTTLNSMLGYNAGGGSAEDDIDLHGAVLRARARDLFDAGGLARSGPMTLKTNVVGWGIQPKPKIDGEALGLSEEAQDEWERNTLREFRIWAENPMCDAERQHNFYGLQQLAFLSELVSGDVFVLFGMKKNARTPYTTTIRLIEADRVSTPDSSSGESESREADGGVPFVAAQIEQIKQLDRYLSSELAANVVSAMLTAFVVTEDDDTTGLEDAVNEEDKITDDDMQLELAPGAIYSLPKGKKIQEINPLRNNSAFANFVETMETVIGASMGIPKEVLVKKYESNYTAARGALLDFWREVRVRRTAFVESFCQPIYEQWLSEAIATGRIDAPGFFDDPAVRQAWCGCMWMGASMGHVDPLKEANAATVRIANNMTTQEQEASEYNGNDWLSNVRQRRKELSALKETKKDGKTKKPKETQKEERSK